MILVATGWTYAELMATPTEIVGAVARVLADQGGGPRGGRF